MALRISIYTEEGKADSLKQAVKIAFTLRPAGPSNSGHSFSTVALECKSYAPNTDTAFTFGWRPAAAFGIHEIRNGEYNAVGSFEPVQSDEDDQDDQDDEGGGFVTMCVSDTMPQGYYVAMTKPLAYGEVQWSVPTLYDELDSASMQGSVMVVNDTSSMQNVDLRLLDLDDGSMHWQAIACTPLMSGESFAVPLEMEFQAYIVKDTIGSTTILEGETLRYPIFGTPISCKELPASSNWKLTQEWSGAIRLTNDEAPELGTPSTRALAESIRDMGAQLAAVLKSVTDTQDRLGLIERSLRSTQDDIISGQKAFLDIRNQLSDVHRNVGAVEAKTEALAGSLNQSQDRLSALHKSAGTTQNTLSVVEKAVKSTQDRLLAFDHSIPVIESSTNMLAESFAQVQNRITDVEKSASHAHEDISLIKRLVVTHSQESERRRVPGHPQGEVSKDLGVQDSLAIIQDQVSALDRRVPVVEGKADKLARAFTQTMENLQITRQQVAGIDHKVPAIEAKAESLDRTIAQCKGDLSGLRASFSKSEDRVSRLSDRVAVVEAKIEELPPTSPTTGSPYTFPSRIDGNPTNSRAPTSSDAQNEDFDPWSSSLFQSLENDPSDMLLPGRRGR